MSAQAQGYQDTAGLYTPEQFAGWRQVTDAVHAKGGRIFVQLWHVGRVSHVDVQPGGAAPVAPSAIRAATKTFVNNGFADVSEPRALELGELPGIVNDFRQAAANAIAAGFDGVEIHGANGYLLEQFIKDGANQRTDAYGGSIENLSRLRLPVLIANGDNDIMVPTALSRDMAQRIPNARLVIYEDAGHGGIFQYHEDFVAQALAFLAQ